MICNQAVADSSPGEGGGTPFAPFNTKKFVDSFAGAFSVESTVMGAPRPLFAFLSQILLSYPSGAYWQMYALRTLLVLVAPVMCGVRLQKIATEPSLTGTQTASSAPRP